MIPTHVSRNIGNTSRLFAFAVGPIHLHELLNITGCVESVAIGKDNLTLTCSYIYSCLNTRAIYTFYAVLL